MRLAVLFFLTPLVALAQTAPRAALNLDLSALRDPESAQVVTTTTTITTTTTSTTVISTTTTTLPLPVPPTTFQFTSPLLNKIMAGQGPASDLPYWYGFRWNRKIHPVIDDWTEFLYREIDTNAPTLVESVPTDAAKFCPNFTKLNRDEKVLFWVKLVTVLMSFESGYDTNKFFDDTKNVDPGSKDKVISSGLLMMSHKSVMPEAYGCQMISPDKDIGSQDLFDPKKNMACAIRIMNHWVKTDGVIADRSDNANGEVVWKGFARYWGPFRHPMLKKDEAGLWGVMARRTVSWQAENEIRDSYLLDAVNAAIKTSGAVDKKIWEASSCRAPHPSLLDERYSVQESHRFTSIVRLMNQTSFCYK